MKHIARKVSLAAFGCTLALSGCLPSADFKVAVKVIDESGRPVPDVLVLVGAYVSVEPPLEAPYDIGFSANRGMTSQDGIARFSRLHGLYEGQKPEDAFYKMLESRQPKKKRRITGVKGGSIVVFAPRYGAFHQSFGVKDSPGFKQELKDRGLAPQDYTGWFGRSDREWNYETVLIETRDILKGGTVTVRVRKTSNPEHPHASFQPAVLWETERATSRVTGATVEDKERVFDFFVAQMEYAVAMSTYSFYKEKLESLRNPQQRKEYTDALRAWGQREHNHDTVVHEWMTRSALALLPQGYEEVKEHAGDILEGVKAEDDGLRPLKHFYNPFDPEYGYKGNPTALQWGAIGYPDTPNNEWDWQDAQRYYGEGDKRKAYKALGHVLHLLEDLSVPMHTRNIRHVYHLDSEAAFELHFSKLAKTNEGLLAVYAMGAKMPAGGGLKERFEGLAKLTFGVFVEDRQPVDFDAFYAWEKGKTGQQIKEPDDRTLDLIGRRLLPRAIEHSAGLLKGFYDGLHPEQFAQAPGDKATSGQDGSKARRENEVAWEEIADAISTLPSAPKRPHRSNYTVPEKDKKEAERRLEKLKEKGDIIPSIVRALDRFKPGSDDGERNLLNLVAILKENPDERTLAALDRIAHSTPTVKFRAAWLDGAEQPVYGFNQAAQEVVESIRVDMARKEWAAKLVGKSNGERREVLASFYWSRTEVDHHKRRGAGWLLNTEFPPNERLSELKSRMSNFLAADTEWKKKILSHMTEELRRLAKAGADRAQVLGLLDDISRDSGDAEIRQYATSIRHRME